MFTMQKSTASSVKKKQSYAGVPTETELERIRGSSNVSKKVQQFGGGIKENKKKGCCKCIQLLIKSTPYKTTVGRVGSKKNKIKSYISSILLAASLVSIAVIFGQKSIINLVDFDTGNDVCVESSEQANIYMNKYKNITNYDILSPIGPLSKNITLQLFGEALNKYNYHYKETPEIKWDTSQAFAARNITPIGCFGAQCYYATGENVSSGTKWPTPYKQSEAELLAKSQKDCSKKVCWDNWGLSIICKWVEFPCSLQLDTKGVYFDADGEFDTSQKVNYTQINYNEEIADSVNTYLFEIFERMNYISSFYCIYMALMIFIGAPYVITSRKLFPTKIQFGLSMLTKPWFILIILLLWYSSEILQLVWTFFFIDTDLLQIIQFAIKDPCFANVDFLKEIYSVGTRICSDIEHSEQLYRASMMNLNYYESVEDTYIYYYYANKEFRNNNPNGGIRYDVSETMFSSSDDILSIYYNLLWDDYIINATECSIDTMLDYIGPTDSSFDLWSFLLFSGAFAALLIQPVLANLIKTIFIMIDPLSPYFGRIEIPYQDLDDDDSLSRIPSNEAWNKFKEEYKDRELLNEIGRFERAKNCPILIIWGSILALICANIALNEINI